jgi:flavin-dependent dehydrogenase
MGGAGTGQLAAAYFQKRFPKLKVAVVEGPHKNHPIVGESLFEVSVDFLLELGMGSYLVEKHYPKYGLTYYFKPDLDNPADRTYVDDEIPTAPPILSFQINRFTFDREVRDRNAQNGVDLVDATVAGVAIKSSDGLHEVTVKYAACARHTMSARWLIDATGRNRVLQKQFRTTPRIIFSARATGSGAFRCAHRITTRSSALASLTARMSILTAKCARCSSSSTAWAGSTLSSSS